MNTTSPADNFLVRNATSIAIATVTLLMVTGLVMFYRQGEASRAARDWVVHTYEVRGHIRLLLGKVKDAEIGERGYLITGNDAYLEPYRDAIRDSGGGVKNALEQHRSISEEIGILKKLTADNPVQQRNLDELDGVVKELLDYLAAAIKARNAQAPLAGRRDSDTEHSKALMDHVRILVRVMGAEETRLLATRTEIDEASAQRNQWLTYSGILLFYLAMTLSIWLYQRHRARAAAQMLRYTQELEKSEEELKMQQEELKASNEELESSSEEIRAANEELEEKSKALEEQNAQIR